MSLINDVLRDLDERRRARETALQDPLEGLRPAPSPPRVRPRTRGIFVVALVGVATFATWVELRVARPERQRGELPAVAAGAPEPGGAKAQSVLPERISELFSATGDPGEPATTPQPVERRGPAAEEPAPPAPSTSASPPVATRAAPAPAPPAAPDPAALERELGALDPLPAPGRGVRGGSPQGGSRAKGRRAYGAGLAAAARGDVQDAGRMLHQALELDPDHARARAALATLLARTGDSEAALELLERGSRRAGDPELFAALEARIRVDRGDVTGAIERLEAVARRLPRDVDAEALRAALYQREERHGEAADLYASLLDRDETRSAWWLGLGISLEALGREAPALEAYRRAGAVRGRRALGIASRTWLEERIASLARDPADAPASGASPTDAPRSAAPRAGARSRAD